MGEEGLRRDRRVPRRWNLWVDAVVVTGEIIFVVPTDLFYMVGTPAAWIRSSKAATVFLTGAVMAGITFRGDPRIEDRQVAAQCRLRAYPYRLFEPLPLKMPKLDRFSLAVFGQMCVGALSRFEYVAILASECRRAAQTIGRSVMISAPVISLMFILGTSSVLAFLDGQPINVIGPIPQTMRAALGVNGPLRTTP